MKYSILILGSVFFLGLCAHAEVVSSSDLENQNLPSLRNSEDRDLKIKARKRLYPGGRDEESLRVQTQLNSIQRKMGPAQEAPEITPAEDSSND